MEEVGVLVVPVDDELVPGQARRARERELARGGDVRSDAFLAQEAEKRDVRERLRAEEDATAADRSPKRLRAGANRLLADDDQRRSVLRREARRVEAAEREHPCVHAGGVREEIWHRPIVPVTVETVQQLLT